jgi:hypothetical protein
LINGGISDVIHKEVGNEDIDSYIFYIDWISIYYRRNKRMKAFDIIEVKECREESEVNELLSTGKWKVVNVRSEKVKIADGKVQVGKDMCSGFWAWGETPRYEIKYKEALFTIYILGRIK